MNRKKITKAALSGLVAVTMVPAMAAPLVANAEGNDTTAETTNKQVTVIVDFVLESKQMVDQVPVTLNAGSYDDYSVLAADVPTGYEMVTKGQQWTAVEGGALEVVVKKVETTTQTVGVNYWDVQNNVQAGEGEVTIASGATTVDVSSLTDIPDGYELVSSGAITINGGWIWVEVKPIQKVTVTLEFNDENGKVVGEPIDCQVPAGWQNPSVLEEFVPEGYTLLEVNNFNFVEGGYYNIDVKKNVAETKEVTLNLIDEATKETLVKETLNVDNDKISFTADELKEYLPDNYEFCYTAEAIMTDSEGNYVVNYLIRQVKTTKEIGVNFWDGENYKQAGEAKVTVSIDANNVKVSEIENLIPEGYELAGYIGDYQINDGWIFVEVKPATTKTVGINFWDVENNKQAGEDEITVAATDNNVGMSAVEALVPEGYELAGYIGDYQINDGWIFVEVKPVTTKTVGINFWDVENKKQAWEDEVTVSIDANNVGMSDILDLVPEGYELTGYIGDYQINDGWIFVEVKPAPTTKTIGVNYWDIVNNVQVSEGVVTVDADANNVNTNDLTDVPEGYEIVWVGDTQINDGWIFVELRPVATTKTVGLNYWDVVNNKQVSEGSVVVDAQATSVNTSTFTDVPEGYELVWTGDLAIMDGWVWVEVRPVVEEPEETAPAKLIISFQDEKGNEILTDKVQTVVSDIEGTSDEVYTFVYGENYDVVIPEGYTYEGECPTVDVNFGQSKQIVLTLTKTAQEPTQPGDEEEPNTPAEGTEESEQTDGTDTGVAMSLAGVFGTMSAALAGMVALLRRKQK